MNNQRAEQILQALVQGIDPHTGEPLKESVLQNAEVLRALLAGIGTLKGAQVRAKRRAQLPENVGKAWTDAELATLRREYESGQSIEEIAKTHGRSTRAIAHRLAKLGLIQEDPSQYA